MTKTLLKEAQGHIPEKSALDYKSFLKVFFERVPKEDVAMMAPENLAHTAQNHLKMAHERKKGAAPQIKIYTPTAKKEGWEAGRTIIDIVNDDMAFLVDSVVAEVIKHNHQIAVFIHPILHAERNSKGKITDIYSTAKKDKTEGQSHIHIELDRVLSKEQCKELQTGLTRVLADVSYSNRDWKEMCGKVENAKKSIGRRAITICKAYC